MLRASHVTIKMMRTKPKIRRLTKAGGGRSYSIILPIDLIRELGWRSKQKLELKRKRKGILFKDWEGEKKKK